MNLEVCFCSSKSSGAGRKSVFPEVLGNENFSEVPSEGEFKAMGGRSCTDLYDSGIVFVREPLKPQA